MFDLCAVGVCCASLFLTSCKKPEAQAAGGRPPAAVTVTEVVVQDVPVYLDQIGNVAAIETVTLRSQVAGKVVAVNFVEGSDVKKGQVLYEIDPRPFRAALAQSEAAVAQAKANQVTAKAEFERMEAVRNTAAVSQSDYDVKKGALAVAEAQVLAAEANVETARLNLDYCTIKSPIDGRTGQRLVDAGNLVKENDTNLVVIQRLDPVYVDFTITESELPIVKRYLDQSQLQVQIFLPSEFERMTNSPAVAPTSQPATAPSSAPAEALVRPIRLGNLVFIDNAVREGTGTIKVRASVENTQRTLWPGQYVRVRPILTIKKDAVLVPSSALQVGQGGAFVYVAVGDVAEMRPVTVGQRHGSLTVVDTGLSSGDKVVTSGHMTLFPGAKIAIMPNQPAAPAGAPPGTAPADEKQEKTSEGASS